MDEDEYKAAFIAGFEKTQSILRECVSTAWYRVEDGKPRLIAKQDGGGPIRFTIFEKL